MKFVDINSLFELLSKHLGGTAASATGDLTCLAPDASSMTTTTISLQITAGPHPVGQHEDLEADLKSQAS